MKIRLVIVFGVLLTVCIFCDYTLASKRFSKGRMYGGNLGEPSKLLTNEILPQDEWFEQILDHFDPRNNVTWKQRYFVNDKFYKPGSPVFLMIGGEGEASAKWMVQGAWIKYAQELNALCFQLEHRYYGKSHPTSDVSTDNLLFLASEQALADLARFITEMKVKYNLTEKSKWIAFGGSYPGSLAAWLREKYPHLIHGAVSSSGPLLAKINFYEYYDVVAESLATYSDNCVESVQKAFNEVEILLKHMIGQRNLDEKFKLCDPIEKSVDNELDIANLFENLASNFAGVVQYNKDNSPHNTVTIDEVCDIMTNTTIGPPVTRLAEINKIMLNISKENCLDYKYDKMIEDLKSESWDSKAVQSGARQWTYQTCFEFGFYQTSEHKKLLFNNKFPTEFFVRQCPEIFSGKFSSDSLNRGVEWTNICYGALNPRTTNVIYVHGSIDPWHVLGLTHSSNRNIPTIYITGTAHCANMYEPRKEDLPQLVDARKKILTFLKDILKQDS